MICMSEGQSVPVCIVRQIALLGLSSLARQLFGFLFNYNVEHQIMSLAG